MTSDRTQGLVMRRYDTVGVLMPEPPPPVLDKFEAYMKSLVQRQKEIYREIHGKDPDKILLGTFEHRRFRRLFRDGPDKLVREYTMKPDRFPLTAALAALDEDSAARQAEVEETERRIPTVELWGLTVIKAEEHEFHMEVM